MPWKATRSMRTIRSPSWPQYPRVRNPTARCTEAAVDPSVNSRIARQLSVVVDQCRFLAKLQLYLRVFMEEPIPANSTIQSDPNRIPALLPDLHGSWEAKKIRIMYVDHLHTKALQPSNCILKNLFNETLNDLQVSSSAFHKKWSVHEGVGMMVASTLLSGQHDALSKSSPKSSPKSSTSSDKPSAITHPDNIIDNKLFKTFGTTSALAVATASISHLQRFVPISPFINMIFNLQTL